MTNDTYGPTSPRQFAEYDPVSCSWRTWPATGLWGSTPFSGTWPRSGMTCGGRAFELPMSGLRMGGSGCSSLLPTPKTSDTNGAGRHGTGGAGLADGGEPVADAYESRSQGRESAAGRDVLARRAATDADRDGLQGVGRFNTVRPDTDRRDRPHTGWGRYEPAIRRWEHTIGRLAPAPTETGARGGQRLSPRLVEWMMGLPDGHVCDTPDLTRNDKLKLLGNGVVPLQGAAALAHLLTLARPG